MFVEGCEVLSRLNIFATKDRAGGGGERSTNSTPAAGGGQGSQRSSHAAKFNNASANDDS